MTTPPNNSASDKKLLDALKGAMEDVLSERQTLAAVEPSNLQTALTDIKTVLERDGLTPHPMLKVVAETMAEMPESQLNNDSFIAQCLNGALNTAPTPWQKICGRSSGVTPKTDTPKGGRPIMRTHM